MLHCFATLAFAILSMILAPNGALAEGLRFPAGAETASELDPSELMLKAPLLLQAGRGEEAVFWFYAGQLRWRSRLSANPDQDPTGQPAAFSALFETIGPDVNAWAFGDIPLLQKTIVSVLEWDRLYPDPSVSSAVAQNTRSGLQNLIDSIARDADDIRRERAANGLPNR